MRKGDVLQKLLMDALVGVIGYHLYGWYGPALVLATYGVGTLFNWAVYASKPLQRTN